MLIAGVMSCTERTATPEDWPQFKRDNFRSSASPVNLDLSNLDEAWTYHASQEPVAAWYGPAKEDAYAKSGPLPSMRDYDLAYYPVIVGNSMYYSSTSDDAVHCIDTKNGKEKWRFTTNAPIRIAPVFYKGNLYFGSDDGFVYSIDADDGDLDWKYSPVPENERLLIQNSRLVSFWPIRTGVLVEDDRVYFGASLLPWKKSYFCAINSTNGSPDGEGCYVREIENMTFEGAMASTGTMLVQPQGRIAPAFFNKATGENKGSLPGTGGCFVLVTEDKHIVHPQASRFKSIQEYVDDKEPEYMSFKGGKEMVIKGDTSFILTDNSLSAYHRKSKKLLWLRRDYQAHRLILSGDALYVGATDTVYAVSPENGLPLWKGNVDGTVYAMASANGALYVSTSGGDITCFRSGSKENPWYARNIDKPAGIDEEIKAEESVTEKETLELKSGPFVQALSTNSVRLTFETAGPTKVSVNWSASGEKAETFNSDKNTQHSIDLPVRKDFIYTYEIITEDGSKRVYEYDNFFNYKRNSMDFSAFQPKENYQQQIEGFTKGMEYSTGICLVVGLDDEQLPIEIARNTDFDVMVLDESSSKIEDFRAKLQAGNVYGRKINALQVADLSTLPLASELANLVWLNTKAGGSSDEVIRLIAPRGLAIVQHAPENWLEDSNLDWEVDAKKLTDGGLILKKHKLETQGEWTHQYAEPDNSAFGGESMWGSTRAEDFEIQWMGRPGPRFQTDRSGRKPSPLAVNGKMFVQGNERVVAVDVYNGNVLWSEDFPGMKRMNIHRDCSNWAADENYIYIAIGANVIKVDQMTGAVVEVIPEASGNQDWGFISLVDDKIIGTSIPKGSSFTDFYGGVGWYDAKNGPMAFKVISKLLFARDKKEDKIHWSYKPQGVIINPTITIYNQQITFVESANVKLSEEGRGGDDLFRNTSLVALDQNTGKVLWKKRIKNVPGKTMYTMAGGTGKYVIVSSNDWKYEIYAYDASNGNLVWDKEQKWFHGDHGGHLSRPAIVNNRLVVKPALYNLATGEQQVYNVPKSGHGCASYALTEQSIFYRGGSVTQFNFDTREFSRWERLRPDCWISTIPAQGLVLSPEAGGGCSCGNWLETSMVMAPISRAPITINTVADDKPDYKQENWGDYTQKYLPNEFIDSVSIEIIAKPGVQGTIHYTLDGTQPTEKSTKYSGPFVLTQNATLKSAIFMEKSGKIRRFERSKSFVRLRPAPSIERKREIVDGKINVLFHKTGTTGKVYYTTNGENPNIKSESGENPLTISGKTMVKSRTIWVENGKEYMSEITAQEIDIPKLVDGTQAEVNPGIRYEYYEGIWKKLPDFNQLTALKKGIEKNIDVSPRKNDYGFGFRYSGFVKVPVDGIYTFYNTSDDASTLMLHDNLLIDNDGSHSAREMKQDISLKAGLHPISVLYYQNEKDQVLSVEIEGPGMERQQLPAEVLFYN